MGLSADGVPVLHHDQALDPRTVCDTEPVSPDDPLFPYAGRPIRELTLARLRTIDAGRRIERFAETQTALPGEGVPTLTEVCELVAPHPDVVLAVEIKTDPSWPDVETITTATVKVLQAHGLTDRVRILAFDWRILPIARDLLPDAERIALVEPVSLDATWMAGHDPRQGLAAAASAVGATMLSPKNVMVTPELVQATHAHNLRLVAWTVNDPADMLRQRHLGADAIVTDYPDRAYAVLGDGQ